ncbi:hypothetical protein GOODEAATRI_006454 [Goodea atripinnis]|uniref:Uncharacterized protein n=1 Tax=Goodea atripinnis TaxID=208336 RepID=A0ABV0P256_9TELE
MRTATPTVRSVRRHLTHVQRFTEGAAGEKQDATAEGSKPKVKVKSIDLPIVANSIRQLDEDVLTNFVEYEELDDICGSVTNRPKPAVEEAADVSDHNSGAHNGPTARQEADDKGNQHPKPGAKQMEVD